MDKRFYHRTENRLYQINGCEGVLFADKATLEYVAGEHGPEIAKYILKLARLDPQLKVETRDGRAVIKHIDDLVCCGDMFDYFKL
jgi:hypothetical protein